MESEEEKLAAAKRRQFKTGIDEEEQRGRRRQNQVELRKTKQIQHLAKRRAAVLPNQKVLVRDEVVEEQIRNLHVLVNAIKSTDPAVQLKAAQEFRKLLSIEKNPPIDEVVASGAVPCFLLILATTKQDDLLFEALWCLTNVASGQSMHVQRLVAAGAVPILIRLLDSGSTEVKEQAVWALGNIAGDSTQSRDKVLQTGIVQPLLRLFESRPTDMMLRQATWTVSNLCRGKPHPELAAVAPVLPYLVQIVTQVKDPDTLVDACWALAYFSDDEGPNNERIQLVVESRVLPRLIELLDCGYPVIVSPCLRTIGNVVTGDDYQTEAVINLHALPPCARLLRNAHRNIVKEACWAISNITAGPEDQIDRVLECGIAKELINIMNTQEYELRKEAAWAVCNAVSSGRSDQVLSMVNDGLVQAICKLLHECLDNRLLCVLLDGLQGIMLVGDEDSAPGNKIADLAESLGVRDLLIKLVAESKNDDVLSRAIDILKEYWEDDDDEEDIDGSSTAPNIDDQEYAFGDTKPQQDGSFDHF